MTYLPKLPNGSHRQRFQGNHSQGQRYKAQSGQDGKGDQGLDSRTVTGHDCKGISSCWSSQGPRLGNYLNPYQNAVSVPAVTTVNCDAGNTPALHTGPLPFDVYSDFLNDLHPVKIILLLSTLLSLLLNVWMLEHVFLPDLCQ